MSFTYYRTLALIPPDVQIVFSDVVRTVNKTFASESTTKITATANLITLYFNDRWSFYIEWDSGRNVLEESHEIAQRFSVSAEQAQRIASCDCRISTSADDDPNMDYFNDYIFVLETLESFEGVILFDPDTGLFI